MKKSGSITIILILILFLLCCCGLPMILCCTGWGALEIMSQQAPVPYQPSTTAPTSTTTPTTADVETPDTEPVCVTEESTPDQTTADVKKPETPPAATETITEASSEETTETSAQKPTDGSVSTETGDFSISNGHLAFDTDYKKSTVMVYMNGTDLEEMGVGFATEDIYEMLDANVGENVNIVIETLGTADWMYPGISGSTAQRYVIEKDQLVLVEDNLGQVNVTESAGLTDFIRYSQTNYPADRYILVMWDHGGGPVYGYGVNAWDPDSDDALTMDEMVTAIADSKVHFNIIGFDACLMGAMEVSYALADYCDYVIASEDFEPGTGWSYTGWLEQLTLRPSISDVSLGMVIVDDFVSDSEAIGEAATLAVIDEANAEDLYKKWKAFALEAKDTLLANNYSLEVEASDRAMRVPNLMQHGGEYMERDYDWLDDFDWLNDFDWDVTMDEYCLVDMMAAATSIESSQKQSDLIDSLKRSVLYAKSSSAASSALTGLSVTIPYGDEYTYYGITVIYPALGFDEEYIQFLGEFAENEYSSGYNWDNWDWDDDWTGGDDYYFDPDYDWGDYFEEYMNDNGGYWDEDWDEILEWLLQ